MFKRPLFNTLVGAAALIGLAVATVGLAYTTPTPSGNPNAGANQAKQAQMAAQRKQLDDARAGVETVHKQIAKVRARIEATFTSKDEYAAAKKEYEAAQAAFDAASKPVLAAARKKPEYLQAVADRAKAQSIIDQANKPAPKADDSATNASASESGSGSEPVSQEDIKAAVDQRWKAGTTIRQIEADALADDPKVDAAKSHRDEAKRAWDAAQAQVTEAMEVDPEYIQLQTQLKTAEQQLASVKQQIAAQQKAAEQAAQQQRASQNPTSTTPRH